jgi:hypothetical protein
MNAAILDQLCITCGGKIPHRRYQDPRTVRACSPHCAGRLARKESPPKWGDVENVGEIEWADGLKKER